MIARGLAAFFGGFTILNLAGELAARGFDANGWWLDLRPLPDAMARVLLLALSAALLAHAAGRRPKGWLARCYFALVAGAALVALANSVQFYWLLGRGRIGSGFPVPLSLFVCAALGFILHGALRPPPSNVPAWRGW